MTDPIKPALTPDEWAAEERSPVGPIDMRIEWAVDEFQAQNQRTFTRHGLAALCLHGQPFGFTSADLELLGYLAMAMRGEGNEKYEDATLNLSHRIAALLPPAQT